MKSVFALSALFAVAQAGSTSLTEANFEEEVFNSGKAAFVKFQAPW